MYTLTVVMLGRIDDIQVNELTPGSSASIIPSARTVNIV
jgi:hypothetical protein